MDGGLEVTGTSTTCPRLLDRGLRPLRRRGQEAAADCFRARWRLVMDTAKVADVVFTTAAMRPSRRLLPDAAGRRGMGKPHEIAPLACIPTTAGTGSEVSMAAVIKGAEDGT